MKFHTLALFAFTALSICHSAIAGDQGIPPILHILKDSKFDVPLVPYVGQCKLNGSKVKKILVQSGFQIKSDKDTTSSIQKKLLNNQVTYDELNNAGGANCQLALPSEGAQLLGRFPVTTVQNSRGQDVAAIGDIVETEIPVEGKGSFVVYKQPTYFNKEISTRNLIAHNSRPSVCNFDMSRGDQYMIISTSKIGGMGDFGLKCETVSKEIYDRQVTLVKDKRSREKLEYATIADRLGQAFKKARGKAADVSIVVLKYSVVGAVSIIGFALEVGTMGYTKGGMLRLGEHAFNLLLDRAIDAI